MCNKDKIMVQNDGKINSLIFLIISLNIILVFVVAIPNYINAQEPRRLHDDTLSVITKSPPSNQNPYITVGKNPSAMSPFSDGISNVIYVANTGENTISVINTLNNSNIGNKIEVGEGPQAIAITDGKIYVANSGENTISVLNATTYKKIVNDIVVGKGPVAILIESRTGTIYVANFDDDTVSVIDEQVYKVVAKIMLNIEPFNSGHIECDKSISPLSQQFYVYSGTECTAKPNHGFEFVSWQENLKGNSTRLLQVASSPSILDSILDFFHMKPDKPEAILNITKFGSFTANFKALPPPVPAEYIATLFTVVITAFIGTWLTPTVIAWRKARNQGRNLDYYHKQISSIYYYGELDEKYIDKLDNLRNIITDEYSIGKISKVQFDKLVDETSLKYREIFKNEIDSLDTPSEYEKENKIMEIKSNIEDAYASGKINELHYNLLQKKLLKYEK
jgi:YVTN family beta-propeller protein